MRLFHRNDIEIELHFSSGEDKVKSLLMKKQRFNLLI